MAGSVARPALPRGLWLPPGFGLRDRAPDAVLCDGHPPDAFALAAAWDDGTLLLARGALGLRPLYYLERDGRPAFFASEIKALCPLGSEIHTFPPGHVCINGHFQRATQVREPAGGGSSVHGAREAAARLSHLLEEAVVRGLPADGGSAPVGVFLSGGVDSSVVAAAAAGRIGPDRLRSFVVGTPGSEDIPQACLVADHLGISHEEFLFAEDDVARVLPDVIYHLESFDAPLVRSSVANYLASRMAARAGCRYVLCGEGGDELFAGYAYLKDIRPRRRVAEELLTLLEGGHANGFQRVDRMTAAFGLEARVPLSAPDVAAFALGVPLEWKIHPETGQDKWLLREAFRGRLPDSIINRPKAKFYEGSGSEDKMERVSDRLVGDDELERERGREVGPGMTLDTKEQLLYYRLFRERFPHRSILETIGWTRTVT
jgi:asparagine synthase (glutamine-hydrolysing)